jgi:pyruvate dehydrogenase E2 component (dihydrolipoamide acetyltransferase)
MATYEFKLPELGEGVMEGEIVKWLVKEGDDISEDQPLVEVMTDKATVAVPSPKKGRVLKMHGLEGEIAKIHALLVTMEVDEAHAPLRAEIPHSVSPMAQPVARAQTARNGADAESVKVLATPVTRRMAREHGIDLAEISGTGPQGRVTKADMVAAIGDGSGAVAVGGQRVVAGPPRANGNLVPLLHSASDERVPMRGLRRKIAEKMTRSKFTAPHSTFVEEMDATALVALRHRLNEALANSGETAKISFLPFIFKALIMALRKFKHFNANFDEARQELIVRGAYNFGVAVATDDGLTVPVVKGVNSLSLKELASEISRLSAAAKDRKLKMDELSAGTFTITSLGQKGGLFATPIINHPEVAILGVHRIRKCPVVRADQVVIREMACLSLSFDHRVIDGAEAAEFTYELIRHLEKPELLFLELA